MALDSKKATIALAFLGCLNTGYTYASQSFANASTTVQQNDGVCKGEIMDGTFNEPLIGATILVKGTTNGTVTDVNGNFTLANVKKGSTLVISYVGYKPTEVIWNGQAINVTLAEDSQVMSDVVVVGYGVQKKVNVTGAVSMVGSEVIESRPVANASQALQGAVPGLNLTVNSSGGMLDNKMSMNIRGQGSINGGDSPLVLIDGIEGDINTLNPQDIESVSVLKDAASASIYGSRAAYGVILITTKSGKAGKIKVSYSGDVRFSTATQLPKMANSVDFANYWNYSNRNSGGSNVFSEDLIQKMKDYQAGKFTDPTSPDYYGTSANSEGKWNDYYGTFANTDWFDFFYKKNVPSTQHNLSISGGNEKLNFLLSGSYLMNQGLIRHGHDEMDRYNFSAKVGGELAKWARFEYTTRWARQKYEKPQYLNGLFFHNIARRWPTSTPIDPNGYWMDGFEVAELEDGGKATTRMDELTQKLRFVITPLEGWNITAEGAIRTVNQKRTVYQVPVYGHMVDGTAWQRDSGYDHGNTTYFGDTRYRENYYAVNVFTDYTRTFADMHNFKVLAGLNFEKYDNDTMWAEGTNLTVSNMPFLSQTLSNQKGSDSYWHRAVAGYFGRINYDYNGKYLAEFNIRYDGSSRFLSDKRWAAFPSVSLGWNIARESFFNNISEQISTLKLRTSWGQLGNTSSSYSSFADWYPFYQQQSIGQQNSSWVINGQKLNTASLPGIINTLLTWETVESWDVGLDWTALNGRLTGSFDWFSRSTKDMVGPAPILGSVLGTDSPQTNNCNMRTNGWELEIGWKDKVGEVGYNVRLNLSDSKSKITSYPFDGEFGNQNIYGYYNDKVLGEIWGYESAGLASSDAVMNEWLQHNAPNWGSSWGAGDVMYKSIDGKDGVEGGANTLDNHGDLKVIGNSTPRYRIGINLGVDWKGIDFSAFFQGVLKRDWCPNQDDPYFWGANNSMWQSCCFEEHLDCWSPENVTAYYPKPYLEGWNSKNHVACDRYIQNAAYLRCKNLQLGYTFPQALVSKASISNCRVYVSVDNLFTITKLSSIFDPEVTAGMWNSGKTYPLQRTWSVGLSLNF